MTVERENELNVAARLAAVFYRDASVARLPPNIAKYL
jgi:hypothetical protein